MAKRSTPPGACGDRITMRCIPPASPPYQDWDCTLYSVEAKPEFECGTAVIKVAGKGIVPKGPAEITFMDP